MSKEKPKGITPDEELLATELATKLKSELLETHVLYAPDLPDIEPNKQTILKLTILIAACNGIVAAAIKLNERLDKKETDAFKAKGKEEWN